MNTNQLPSSANFVHYTSYIYILMHNRSNANRSNLIIILLGNFPNQNFCHITPLSTGPKLYIRLHCPMMTSLAVHQMKFLSQKQSPMELLIIWLHRWSNHKNYFMATVALSKGVAAACKQLYKNWNISMAWHMIVLIEECDAIVFDCKLNVI